MKDLIILGNGMAGMTAALYASRANLDFKFVGREEYDFGQIGNAILVENYPCAPNNSGFNLACTLHDQLVLMGVKVEEKEVFHITPVSGNETERKFLIEYSDQSVDTCRSIIYALGAKHRELSCKIGEGIPIHYCALCDGALYKDKTVAIIGGGDVAFTQAEYLSKICKKVMIVMCDENITAAPSTTERVKKIDNIEIIYNFPVVEIYMIRQNLFALEDKEEKAILANGIFVAIGMIPNTEALAPMYLNENRYVKTNQNLESSCQGLFAAGDVREKNVRQAITAAADGAIAVNSVINYLKEVNANVKSN